MRNKIKKSLGQNFLKDKNIVNYICNVFNINQNSSILEIGPGTGNLTDAFINKKPKNIIVIEKDKKLSNLLSMKYKNKIKIINDDFLRLDLNKIKLDNLIIFGNLPYNISTQILTKLIKDQDKKINFKKMVLMFQKEVADRITAKFDTKNYGRLSVISQLKFNITKVKDISPNSFYPIPKVNSALLKFELKNKFFSIKEIKNLEHVTNIFFNLLRKMIKKPLKLLFKDPEPVIKKLKLNIEDRPQKLENSIFYRICEEYEKLID